MTERDGQAAEGEQELLRLYILFGLLFRAAMADWGRVRQVPLKLSYHWFFEELSRWAVSRNCSSLGDVVCCDGITQHH